jgi:ribosomal protein S6
MNVYELVVIIDATLTKAAIDEVKKKVTSLVQVVATDDIGLLTTVYPMRGNPQSYYISYHVEVDPTQLPAIQNKLQLDQGIIRFFFYRMGAQEKFVSFADMKKEFVAIEAAEAEARESREKELVKDVVAPQEDVVSVAEEKTETA